MGLLRLLRRFPRVHLDTPVALAFGNRAFLATASDISEGGMAIMISDASIVEGDLISLSFKLATSVESLSVSARVIHVLRNPDGPESYLGLQFTGIDEEAKRLLRRYIKTRRFLFGDLRAPSSSTVVGERMTQRLRRLRDSVEIM